MPAYDADRFGGYAKMRRNKLDHPPVGKILLGRFAHRELKVGVRDPLKLLAFCAGQHPNLYIHAATIAYLAKPPVFAEGAGLPHD